MTNLRTIVVCVAVAILALSAGYATHQLFNDAPSGAVSDSADVDALWRAELIDLSGGHTSVAHWRGSVVVVNFWATWCAPCREEMPAFVAMQRDYAGKGVQFVGIAADQVDKVQQFASELQINYPLLTGGMEVLDLSTKLGNRISALPFTVVLDRTGKIAYRQLGILRPEKLRPILEKLS